MSPLHRRQFLQRSALLSGAAAAMTPLIISAQPADQPATTSAADRLRVAVVGVRSRGMNHVGGYLGRNNCEIVAVCDADSAVIGSAMSKITKAQKEAPRFVQDFRKLLDDKSIDVISIATPNHWHVLMSVWAMRAGKDVYVEKPVSHNVREGRILADTMAKTGRICQVGTQSRSMPGMRDAIAYIHDGKIGEVKLGYGTCYKPRGSIGDVGRTKGDQTPPATMDYDLWCGPAAKLPPRRNGKFGPVHYDWHWVWEYGNGDFGNQGVHEADKARWGLRQEKMPIRVVSLGGRFGYVDDGETPNTQLSIYDFADGCQLLFEVRGLNTKDYKGSKVGNIWFGSEGYVVCPSYSSGIAYDNDGKKVAEFKGGNDNHHFDNFVRAVRSRKAKDLHCSAEEGHQSASLCHLANISYRLGAEATLAETPANLTSSKPAAEALTRMREHLTENKVDLTTAKGLVGVTLTIDPAKETITDAGGADLAKAKAMLFREYRKGYEVTES
jgi:predicted dehydrogenase